MAEAAVSQIRSTRVPTHNLDAEGAEAVVPGRDDTSETLARRETNPEVAGNEAVGEGNVEEARDEELDEMYTSCFRELLTYMIEDARNITPCTHLLFMAKNVERIGDHTTNVAETIYFLVHGTRLKETRRKGDRTAVAPGVGNP